uniref:Uncharacterized protein n=1 Tax=Bionectria ochroleuca TaxID=29856 RepID=A0A8H7TMM2_BIOOC
MVPGICAPDYTKSPDDVILETLSKIHERFPQFIRGCMEKWPLRASSMEDALGPSWLPDITAACYQHTKNAGPGPHRLRISQDFLLLTLGSRFIGKCHPSPIKLGSEPEETLRRIAGLMYSSGEDLHSFAGSEIRVRRKENLPERILFALVEWLQVWRYHQTPELVQVLLSTFSTIARYKDIGRLGDIPFTAEQLLNFRLEFKSAAKYFANKSFFWTDTGLFGTCSDRLQEGDRIVLSPELWRPFAVRTRPDPSGESNHYHMVDWVFVDGLEGATMDAQLMSEIEETPLSDIYIH